MYKQHKVVLLPTNNKGVIDLTLGNDGILNLEPNNGGLILGVNQDNTVNIKVLDPAPKVYTEADVKYFMDVAVQWGRNESNYQKDHYQFIRETLNKPAAGELINN